MSKDQQVDFDANINEVDLPDLTRQIDAEREPGARSAAIILRALRRIDDAALARIRALGVEPAELMEGER